MEFHGARFFNADCVTGARKNLAADSVDVIITDPPYGIQGDRLHRHYNRDERFVVGGYIEVPSEQYGEFTRAWITQAERVLRPGGTLFVVSGYTNLYFLLDALRQTSLREVNHIIWKYNFGVFTSRKFVSSHYHILYYEKPGGRRTFHVQSRFATNDEDETGANRNYRDREDVWVINREYKPGAEKNKNELPKALLVKMLQYGSSPGDVVCDFFMGGCSTAAVAIGMNRRFVGFELSKTTFRSRVRALRCVVPGELLPTLTTPATEDRGVANARKPWSQHDLSAIARRYRELSATGMAKRQVVTALCAEFQRGSWSIIKVLKRVQSQRIVPVAPLLPRTKKDAASL